MDERGGVWGKWKVMCGWLELGVGPNILDGMNIVNEGCSNMGKNGRGWEERGLIVAK